MSEKFELPFQSGMVPKLLELNSKIQFRCHKGISCFNACCRQADITLTPYDIIRLRKRLDMSSADFLKAHTVPFEMDQHGVPGAKMRTDNDGACLFMIEEGCSVYEDRPSSCRYYPLGHLAMKPKDATVEETHYFLVKEDHCKGHEEDRELSIKDYLAEQDVIEYDAMNKEWLQIMLKKKSTGPTVGAPSESSLQMFFMCSYDLDRFRRFVLSDAFKNAYALEDSVYEVLAKEDISLMHFGVRLMKQVFFGELTIPEQDNAWDKRMSKRKEIWEARTEAEIERRKAMEDKKYKDDV